MKVVVEVWLKPGIPDPVGKDLAQKAKARGWSVLSISTGKRFDIQVDTKVKEEAKRIVTEACEKLLANQTVERFEIIAVGDS